MEIIQGYINNYNLTYTLSGLPVIANSSNIYQFRILKDNIDEIWKSGNFAEYKISFYNYTLQKTEIRNLIETEAFYYATIPSSILKVKGRLYVSINFIKDDNDESLTTKQMDSPIMILSSEGEEPEYDTIQPGIQKKEYSLSGSNPYIITLDEQVFYLEEVIKSICVYLDGRLLSSNGDYSVNIENRTLTINKDGQLATVIFYIPDSISYQEIMAGYADEAGRVSNSLKIGTSVYDGSLTVSLPEIPTKAVLYAEQELTSLQKKQARSNLNTPQVSFGYDITQPPENPNDGDIWIILDNEEIPQQLPIIDREQDEGKILIVKNGSWIQEKPAEQDIVGLPNITNQDNGKILQVQLIENKPTWTPINLGTRLLPDPSAIQGQNIVCALSNGIWQLKQAKDLFTPTFIQITLKGNTEEVQSWTGDSIGGYTQTINGISIITSNSSILATPAPNYYKIWATSSIYCQEQGENADGGYLIFHCDTAPTVNIIVNIVYFGEVENLISMG